VALTRPRGKREGEPTRVKGVVGTVISVDSTAKSFVVHPAKGRRRHGQGQRCHDRREGEGVHILLGWRESEGKVGALRSRALITGMFLLLAAVASAAGQAASTGTTGSTSVSGDKASGKHGGGPRCPGGSIAGRVASVDPTAKIFVVHPAEGSDVTVKVNDKTRYDPKGKGWNDVQVDARVTVRCHRSEPEDLAVTVHFGR